MGARGMFVLKLTRHLLSIGITPSTLIDRGRTKVLNLTIYNTSTIRTF